MTLQEDGQIELWSSLFVSHVFTLSEIDKICVSFSTTRLGRTRATSTTIPTSIYTFVNQQGTVLGYLNSLLYRIEDIEAMISLMQKNKTDLRTEQISTH